MYIMQTYSSHGLHVPPKIKAHYSERKVKVLFRHTYESQESIRKEVFRTLGNVISIELVTFSFLPNVFRMKIS